MSATPVRHAFLAGACLAVLLACAQAAAPPKPVPIQEVTPAAVVQAVAAQRGQVVLLHLYASWCPPCRTEWPGLVSIARTYRGQGLVVLAVSLDETDTPLSSFLGEEPPPFAALRLDPRQHGQLAGLLNQLGVTGFTGGIPFTAFFGRNGRIVQSWSGRESAEHYEQLLQTLL